MPLKIVFVRSQNAGTKNQPKEELGPDIPVDIRPKTSVRPSNSWKKQAFWHGHPARTSMKKLQSEKLRAAFSFPKNWSRQNLFSQALLPPSRQSKTLYLARKAYAEQGV